MIHESGGRDYGRAERATAVVGAPYAHPASLALHLRSDPSAHETVALGIKSDGHVRVVVHAGSGQQSVATPSPPTVERGIGRQPSQRPVRDHARRDKVVRIHGIGSDGRLGVQAEIVMRNLYDRVGEVRGGTGG